MEIRQNGGEACAKGDEAGEGPQQRGDVEGRALEQAREEVEQPVGRGQRGGRSKGPDPLPGVDGGSWERLLGKMHRDRTRPIGCLAGGEGGVMRRTNA